MDTPIGEKLLFADVAGLLKSLNERLGGKRGRWWARKLQRLLDGELVGRGCTDIKPIKQGIRVEGGGAELVGLFELYEQTDAQGRRIMLSPGIIRSDLLAFSFDACPALDCTLSEITCSGICAEKLVEALGDDAYLPVPIAATFIKTNLQPNKDYVILLKHPESGIPLSLIVRSGDREADTISIGSCSSTQEHPRKSIFVHLDYLSKNNEDVMTEFED